MRKQNIDDAYITQWLKEFEKIINKNFIDLYQQI